MIRTTVIAFAMATTTLVSSTALAQSQAVDSSRHQALKQELEVMNTILETRLTQLVTTTEEQPKWMFNGRLQHTYLAGQGVVYEVNLPGSMGFHWRHVMPKFKRDGEQLQFPKMTKFSEALGEIVVDIKEQRHAIRELERAQRNADQSKRELHQQELELAKARLEEARQKLEEERKVLRATAGDLREQHQKIRQQRQEQIQQHVAQFEQTLAETLCTYGSSLASLPANETISVVIKDAGNKEQGGRDKVYIFNQTDIQSCGNAENAGSLLKNAVTYSY